MNKWISWINEFQLNLRGNIFSLWPYFRFLNKDFFLLYCTYPLHFILCRQLQYCKICPDGGYQLCALNQLLRIRTAVKVGLKTSVRIFSQKMPNGLQFSIIILVSHKKYRSNLDEVPQWLCCCSGYRVCIQRDVCQMFGGFECIRGVNFLMRRLDLL